MGNGKFINGKLNFIVSSEYPLSNAEKNSVKAQLQNASNFMFEATGGQVEFGDIYIVDNSFGKVDAEILLINKPGETSGGTKGLFGKPNEFTKINKAYPAPPNIADIDDPGIIVHELAHHIWDLGDEYAGQLESFVINKLINSPNLRTIPVLQPLVVNNSFQRHRILLQFNNSLTAFESFVDTNNSTEIVLDRDCPDLPTNCSSNFGYRQDVVNIKCHPDPNTCIMGDRGRVYFCGSNHSLALTDQHVKHQMSCSNKIITTPNFTNLVIPFVAPNRAPSAVNFLDLEKAGRFSVVFDYSGSMSGEKLEYTKQGVKYWIDNFSLADDYLSIIAYNSSNNVLLPLTKVSSIPNGITQLKNDVEALIANGQTNIRDAVIEGVNQITSRPNRAYSQAVLVLTDGKHNRPIGSSLLEAITTLNANDVKAMTIAIGEPDDVNFDDLDDLALTTNGLSNLVGFSNPIDIETALTEANLFLIGGLLDSNFTDFVPSAPQKKYSDKIYKLYKTQKNPSLNEICKILGSPIKIKGKMIELPFNQQLFRVKNILVEKGCLQANFTINYRTDADVDIFLINPSNELVEIDNDIVKKISDADSHKIILVNKPKPGVWRLIMFVKKLSQVAAKTTVNITVGGKNRELSVWGSSNKSYYKKGEPIQLNANANLGSHSLSGLKVYADIFNNEREKITLELIDGSILTTESGKYTVEYNGLKKGKYKGIIYIEGQSESINADSFHIVTHSKANVNSFNFAVKTGKFKRAIPFYFQKSN